MSEPSETGGLPLDLNAHQQQQPTGSTIHQPSPPRVDYRKTSQSSNDLPKRRPAPTPAPPALKNSQARALPTCHLTTTSITPGLGVSAKQRKDLKFITARTVEE
ncbi:hypothetical protein J4E80_003075 [Alternaria sp. BMP 0032]|nr:hypothetical protein J4E80_003075 [Alternaria sp. BMP 0032]